MTMTQDERDRPVTAVPPRARWDGREAARRRCVVGDVVRAASAAERLCAVAEGPPVDDDPLPRGG